MGGLDRNEGYEWTSEGVCTSSKIQWGITEQANGMVAILVNAPGGVLTGKQLRVANLHRSVRNIVACPGKGLSTNSRGDTLELAAALDREWIGGTESGAAPRHGELVRKGLPRDKVPEVIGTLQSDGATGCVQRGSKYL